VHHGDTQSAEGRGSGTAAHRRLGDGLEHVQGGSGARGLRWCTQTLAQRQDPRISVDLQLA
jgi:hypothetical protein